MPNEKGRRLLPTPAAQKLDRSGRSYFLTFFTAFSLSSRWLALSVEPRSVLEGVPVEGGVQLAESDQGGSLGLADHSWLARDDNVLFGDVPPRPM